MNLSQHEKNFFKTFGYLALPGLFKDSIAEIIAESEPLWKELGGGHAGKPHDGKVRSSVVQFIDRRDKLCALLDDPRICGIASDLLGPDFNYWGSDGNYYVGDTPWHSDGINKDFPSIKFAFYLDRLTRDSGALRVIPGSHRVGEGFADGLTKDMPEGMYGVNPRDLPAVALETQPGDLVLFNSNIKHGAFGGSERRRMFTIVVFPRYPKNRENELR